MTIEYVELPPQYVMTLGPNNALQEQIEVALDIYNSKITRYSQGSYDITPSHWITSGGKAQLTVFPNGTGEVKITPEDRLAGAAGYDINSVADVIEFRKKDPIRRPVNRRRPHVLLTRGVVGNFSQFEVGGIVIWRRDEEERLEQSVRPIRRNKASLPRRGGRPRKRQY